MICIWGRTRRKGLRSGLQGSGSVIVDYLQQMQSSGMLRMSGCQDGLGLSCHSFISRPLKLGKTVKSERLLLPDIIWHRLREYEFRQEILDLLRISTESETMHRSTALHNMTIPLQSIAIPSTSEGPPAIGSNSSITERWGWVVWAQRPKNIEVCYSSWIQKSLSSNKREKMLGTTQQAKPRQISPKEVR